MIDLHIHSKRSDGSYSLEAIAMLYISMGFKYIGITDHDRLIDYNEIKKAYRGNDIHIIPGVEVSSYDYETERKVHLLGYFIKNKAILKDLLGKVTLSRRDVAKHIIEALQKDGYDINFHEVLQMAGTGGVYKQHILQCLRKKGYEDISESDFKSGGKYYFPVEYADYKEAIDAIKEAGGIAVLAHPGETKVFDLIPKLVAEGLDGIQIKHPSHSEEDVKRCIEIADQYNLIKVTGSDNHGKYSDSKIDFSKLQLDDEQEKELIAYLDNKIQTAEQY